MQINELVDRVKAKGAYSKRRAAAVAAHGGKVVSAGIEAAQHVAKVAMKSLKSTAQVQKAALADSQLPLKQRLKKLKVDTSQALADAKVEVSAAASSGYRTVSDKLAHVTAVTQKEQALEKKIRRKATRVKRTAQRHADMRGTMP